MSWHRKREEKHKKHRAGKGDSRGENRANAKSESKKYREGRGWSRNESEGYADTDHIKIIGAVGEV